MGLLCDTCISKSTCKFKKVFKTINIMILKIDGDSPFNISCRGFNNSNKNKEEKVEGDYKRTKMGFVKE